MDEQLKKLGLTESERRVYGSCLKLDSAKASVIAEYSNIERQATYYILRKLMKKGLVSETFKSGVAYYSCIDPLLLLDNFEEERKIKENAVREISKEYKKLKNINLPKPNVEVFQGIEGFKSAAREIILGEDVEVYSIISEKIIKFRPIFLEPYVKKRVEKGIRVKVISEDSELLREYEKENKRVKREMRFMDSIIKGKDYEMAISKDKVIFLKANEKDQMGIKIHDPSFAELQRNIFKILWNNSKF